MKINNIKITGLTNDSRRVLPGYAFFAIDGNDINGTDFIPSALAKGAAVIVTDEKYKGESFKVPNIRRFLIDTAVRFFQPLPENIIAVTGTNGKTSTVHFCRHILENMGKNAASIGTIGLIHKGAHADMGVAGNTSPDPVLLCDILHKLKAQGCDYVAIEASSIGIEQDRMTALPVKVAGFTNLTRDHLDYHGTMERYFAEKKKLFTDVLDADGTAVLNADDDASFPDLAAVDRKIISYGKNGADIRLVDAEYGENGQKMTLAINEKNYACDIDAPGVFQTYNMMCAIGMVMGLGFDAGDVVKAAQNAPAPVGRMQFAGTPVKGGGVYVDYAHTPDGLENVLKSARGLCKGRLMVLFGAGGDRDPGKRPMMGRVADGLADIVYITDDNPRTEEPAPIREQIAAACPKGIVVNDGRAAAIRRAVGDMRERDILVIAGKGHEDYQVIGTVKHHFSDIEEVQKSIKELS
ncbi:MAG: UDP-N-acetylmuramoyl-L-alanyl-D-glutamate--2,6-diaminopimelate ligase [Rickettsiales bacterium]|jgi:UDP-N-acetylmuramoyl-L-alanyl-D-glutamate--2,6-diaminopimelate ligase|nr:UDP-N-acetylmuramoyl-L-alanyl-D-glutamate--2,6-diaminopimelate ligase [Rickettsiales bacterium]